MWWISLQRKPAAKILQNIASYVENVNQMLIEKLSRAWGNAADAVKTHVSHVFLISHKQGNNNNQNWKIQRYKKLPTKDKSK